MKKSIIILIFIISVFYVPVYGQGFSATGGIGGSQYLGDLNDKLINLDIIGLTGMLALNYDFNNKWRVRLVYLQTTVKGMDSLSTNPQKINRNLSFISNVGETSLQVVYHTVNKGLRTRFYPYFFGGVGYYRFDPKADLNGERIRLQPLGTEGQFINEEEYPEPYKLNQVSIPFGMGLTLKLTDRWDIGIEGGYHKLFTDYLDDVSTRFPDSSALAGTPNGALAIQLSSRNLDGTWGPRRGVRGSEVPDSYGHLIFTATYYPSTQGRVLKTSSGKRKGSSSNKKKSKNDCYAF